MIQHCLPDCCVDQDLDSSGPLVVPTVTVRGLPTAAVPDRRSRGDDVIPVRPAGDGITRVDLNLFTTSPWQRDVTAGRDLGPRVAWQRPARQRDLRDKLQGG